MGSSCLSSGLADWGAVAQSKAATPAGPAAAAREPKKRRMAH